MSTATDGVTVVTVTGEIDHTSTGPLIQALDLGALGARPHAVVDMRHVTFMDSSGINVLLAARLNLASTGGWLRLADAQDSVMRIDMLSKGQDWTGGESRCCGVGKPSMRTVRVGGSHFNRSHESGALSWPSPRTSSSSSFRTTGAWKICSG
ncbi:STAS domain-containing protein [Streptomyces sp. NPDC046197]|uniref:STAS domain-containing protein n=1 Tax=Streptomyces sp. NPDC046197 TaxID=3154337 RepID=UPI003401D8E4